MADEKHESKRSCYSRHKWLPAAAAILLLVFLAAGFSFRYISFMSQTIYQESTSHLEEVLYKSNSMLKEMVRKNLTYLHLCNGFLKNTSNEDEIQAYIEEAQQAAGFVDFYFLSYDGNYMTVTGGNRLPWPADQSGRKALRWRGYRRKYGAARQSPDACVHLPRNAGQLPGLCLRCRCHHLL